MNFARDWKFKYVIVFIMREVIAMLLKSFVQKTFRIKNSLKIRNQTDNSIIEYWRSTRDLLTFSIQRSANGCGCAFLFVITERHKRKQTCLWQMFISKRANVIDLTIQVNDMIGNGKSICKWRLGERERNILTCCRLTWTWSEDHNWWQGKFISLESKP